MEKIDNLWLEFGLEPRNLRLDLSSRYSEIQPTSMVVYETKYFNVDCTNMLS